MIVDYLQNEILIEDDDSELSQINKSQIKMAWGFEKQNNTYSLSNSPEHVLPKLIDYFIDSNINYSLTESCAKYLNKINNNK